MDTENELQQLKIDKDNPIGVSEPDADLEIFAKFDASNKAKKEEKKRKKKEKKSPLAKKLDSIIGDIDTPGPDDEALSLSQMAKSIKKNSSKKGKGVVFDTDGFMDSDGKPRKKKKDLYKKYEEQYRDEKALLQALLKETSGDSASIKKVLHEMLSSRVRGMSKTATDLASTLVSANGNRLQIIKAVIDLKNKINDLVNKEETRSKGDGDHVLDPELFGSQLMSGLFSQGNKDFNNALRTNTAVSDEEYQQYKANAMAHDTEQPTFTPIVPNVEVHNTPLPEGEIGQEQEVVQKVLPAEEFDPDLDQNLTMLNEELKDDPIYGRSDAGDKLIEHEADGVVIKIKRWVNNETGACDWEFIAVNKYGEEIDDYEVPSKKKVAPVRFNDDTNTASDTYGRMYNVFDLCDM